MSFLDSLDENVIDDRLPRTDGGDERDEEPLAEDLP